jgi:opacity protein-like surface antigen
MRRLIMAAAAVACCARPSFAQTDRAYVNVGGGVAFSAGSSSGDVLGEVGVRVARNLFVFGSVGQIHDLDSSMVQPAVDATTFALSSEGVTVTGTGRVPAWQTVGGARYLIPLRGSMTPYLLGGVGVAHLAPTAEFVYGSGTIPGAAPAPGDDVTAQLISLGDYTQPASTNAFMFTIGGGVQVPVAPRISIDVGYRMSRINTDTPVNAQSVIAGVGYRF